MKKKRSRKPAGTMVKKRSRKPTGMRRGGHAKRDNARFILVVAVVLMFMGCLFWFRLIY
jgi:hypothetical protein